MPELFRKRLIPNECIPLKNDTIHYQDDSIILTSWDTLKPKATLAKGYSLYVLEKGYKISRFMDANDNFICWYCDIIQYEYNAKNDSYIFTDLLADILIYEDGSIKVIDLDELAQAHEEGLITTAELHSSLYKTNALLQEIYSGDFKKYTDFIDNYAL
ncbi:MAG: DUF402 domain-containing protein [Lachnospiraceae bacterium]|nr:DUF402 domain-containing protein [Lachnospiraceae bacterium]